MTNIAASTFTDNHALAAMEARVIQTMAERAAEQKLAEEFERLSRAAERVKELTANLSDAEKALTQARADNEAISMHRIGMPRIDYHGNPDTDSQITAQIEVTFTNPLGESRTVSLRSLSPWSLEAKVLYAHPEVWPAPLLTLGNGDPEKAMQVYLRGISRGHL